MIPLAFLSPWMLAALGLLPVVWWLLRLTPPSPREVRFPAIRLLFGLDGREDTPARTPWWVMALRLAAAGLLILAAAHPVLSPVPPGAATRQGALLVAIDDGWASARDWPARQAWLDSALAAAEREGRAVALLNTAPSEEGAPPTPVRLTSAADARAAVQALTPKPWPVDRARAQAALAELPREALAAALWVSDGLDDGHARAFAAALQALAGRLDLVTGAVPHLLLPPADGSAPDRLVAPVRRLAGFDAPERVAVRALDGEGRVLARDEARFEPGKGDAEITLRLPPELRNRVVRIDIEGERGAAPVALLDQRWRRRPVGLAVEGAEETGAPLLEPLYYVRRALAPYADLHEGTLSRLLSGELTVLVLADVAQIKGDNAARLERWMEQGGVLVRFAGPALAQAAAEGGRDGADPFLPVALRAGGRSLGGAMSWTSPMGLAPLPEEGPLAGLASPADVAVTAQVLAEPALDLSERTWARLEDGTPLVTAARRGKGWVVLVHTTANAEWSTLALSGLYVDMLRRFVALADGIGGGGGGALAPVEVLDGFGRLTAPRGAAVAIAEDPAELRPGPAHPPGFYGEGGARIAFNLSPALGRPVGFEPPPGVERADLAGRPPETDLKGWLLAAALGLFVLDLMVSLSLRGMLVRGAAVLALAVAASPARAASPAELDAALSTRLACVVTGDAEADGKCRSGLGALSRALAARSTAALAVPASIDIEKDAVLFYPLLYWPVTDRQKPPSAAAADKLNDYLRRGGMIVFDTGEPVGGTMGDQRLKALAEGLALPPLAPVTDEHVLTRSFYLLKEMPGRFDGGGVWAEAGRGSDNDGVSPVVIGGQDWIGAWAADERGRPLYAAVPGGERQREMALRFGINLVMYALTGNYKADQVHVPAIMERLGR